MSVAIIITVLIIVCLEAQRKTWLTRWQWISFAQWVVLWLTRDLKNAQFLDMQDILERNHIIVFTGTYAIGKLLADCSVEIIMKACEWQQLNSRLLGGSETFSSTVNTARLSKICHSGWCKIVIWLWFYFGFSWLSMRLGIFFLYELLVSLKIIMVSATQ